jgi:hypothetical protein
MESDGLTKGVNKPSTHKKMREERGEVSSFCRLRGGSHVFAREERRGLVWWLEYKMVNSWLWL